MNPLIEKAKSFNGSAVRKRIKSDDEIELALAYIKGELSGVQLEHALYQTTNSHGAKIYNFVVLAIRQAYEQNKITIKEHSR